LALVFADKTTPRDALDRHMAARVNPTAFLLGLLAR